MGVIVSRLREDFLCQARVSAAKMGEKEDAKLKWTLLSMVICSNFPRNSERKLAHRIANAHDYQEMLWTGSNVTISSGKRRNARVSSHFLSPHLAPVSPFAYHSLVFLSISLMHHSNPTVPIPLPPSMQGICLPCQSWGCVISKFCVVRGPGNCPPRGRPRAFDTHVVSYPLI